MSREVRRVPIGWKHPVEHNPHWEFQQSTPFGRSKPASRLHSPTEMFSPLFDDYRGSVTDWQEKVANTKARQGRDWNFSVEYHLTGLQGREDREPVAHPFYVWSDDGQTETSTTVRDEDHLNELCVAQAESERPNPGDYMPVFDVPVDELGWCLYETVSEGTPVTPVFATADELIDHLATVGQDWDQEPMRRTSAEALVRSDSSFGSMVISDGVLYQSDKDADVLQCGLSGGAE